jgi:hypothetical protein
MTSKARRDSGSALEFNLIMAVAFIAFFIAIAVKRLMPWNWGRQSKSVFGAAKSAACNSVPFAFM